MEDSPTGKDKTRIIFSAAHKPGLLYHALGEFAKRDINLTKIESRPTKQMPMEYNSTWILRDIEPRRVVLRH